MRHGGQVDCHGFAGHVLAQHKTQESVELLEGLALHPFAQGDQLGLLVGHFDADVMASGNRRLHTDALGSQGQGQVIRQRSDLVDTYAHLPIAGLDEIRFHAELGEGRPAVDLHHVSGSAERFQRLFDDTRAVLVDVLTHDRLDSRVEDLVHVGQLPIQTAFRRLEHTRHLCAADLVFGRCRRCGNRGFIILFRIGFARRLAVQRCETLRRCIPFVENAP